MTGSPPAPAAPTLRKERALLRGGADTVAGMDEVGRGSPAGPAVVGVVVVDGSVSRPPTGVRDSKLLAPRDREALVPAIRAWARAWAVGHASPAEVDALGVSAALGLAGRRALAELAVPPDVVLLDGNYDWLTVIDETTSPDPPPVVTHVRADRMCASVAAASVLAKVTRDAVMSELAEQYPEYGWDRNRGYGTATHFDALRRLGPTPHHRITWRLPGGR